MPRTRPFAALGGRTGSCTLVLLLVAACAGCHSVVPARIEAAPAVADRSEDPTARLQRSLHYRQALLRYESRDYAGALALVDQLLADPSRTEPERTFLQRQRAICVAGGIPLTTDQRPKKNAARSIATLADCGPRALLLVCLRLGVAAKLEDLRRIAGTTPEGTTMAGLAKAAQAAGLHARGVQVDREALRRLDTPAVAWVEGDHYVAVLQVTGDEATIRDPNHLTEETIAVSDLLLRCGGVLLEVRL